MDQGTISEKRQKILDQAFAQLKKSRAALDPQLLVKIRRMIAGSPEMMKALGLNERLEPKKAKDTQEPQAAAAPKAVKTSPPAPKKAASSDYEKVDQAKTMEVMAKLMALNPDGKEQIKSVIKKAAK